jgi:hypothetical protein
MNPVLSSFTFFTVVMEPGAGFEPAKSGSAARRLSRLGHPGTSFFFIETLIKHLWFR